MDTITATFSCRCKSDGKPCTQQFPSAKARGRHEREQHTKLIPGMYVRKGTDGVATYYAKVKLADGKFHDRAFGTNKTVAIKCFEELRADARRLKCGLTVLRSLTDIIQLFKDLNYGHLAQNTQYSYTSTFKLFTDYLRSKHLDPDNLKVVKVSDVEGFREWQLSRGGTASSFNVKLAVLRQLHKWAAERDYTSDPSPYSRCKRAKAVKPHPEWLKEHELAAVIRTCGASDRETPMPTSLADMVTILAYTGMRPGELASRLRWEEVDLEEKVIHVRNRAGALTKTRTDRSIPMAPQVVEVLERMRGDRKALSGVIFPIQPCSIRQRLHRVYEKLDYVNKDLYTLRHTFASLSIRAGVPVEVVMKLLGHTDIKMTMRYAHVAHDSIRAAVDKMSSFCAKAAAEPTGALKVV